MPNRAWAELGLLSLVWGGSFLSIRVALDEMPFVTTVAFRVGLAALVLWAWVALRRMPLPRDPRLWGAMAVMGAAQQRHPVLADGLGAAPHRDRAQPRS